MTNSDLTNDDIERAYTALSDADKANVDSQVEALINALKSKRVFSVQKLQFGRKQALELLAKLGIWGIKNNLFVEQEQK